jgi:hypothetical protein
MTTRFFDQIVAKDTTEDNKMFSIVDRFMVLLKPRIGLGVSDICNRWQGRTMETYGAYDDVYVAKSETEKRDLIERLRGEIMKMDTNKKPHTVTSIGELEQ